MNSILNISPGLLSYLQAWHKTSTDNQVAKGVDVDLPFHTFLDFFEPRQLESLQRAFDAGRIWYQQDDSSEYAYVLSWKSYAARTSNRMDKDTAIICSRLKSKQLSLPQQGDTLRESHRNAIAASLTGKEKSDEHKKAIGEANKGQPKTAWSPGRKLARSKLIAEKKAAENERRKAAEDAAWARLEAKRNPE